MYSQGDIVVVRFPFTDGSEFKKRPALILSNAKVNKTGDYLLVQITSKTHHDDLSMIIDNRDCSNPLPLKSSIRAHKIFTAHESLLLSKISKVTPFFLKQVSVKINTLMEIS